MSRFGKFIHRVGYARAAGQLQRMGHPTLAEELRKQARDLE
jgi:hypothetical protein